MNLNHLYQMGILSVSVMTCDGSVTEVSFGEQGILPSMAVVRAVAESEGVDPLDLPPLYDEIDSSVVDVLFERIEQVRLEFTYNGYEVTVSGDERVVVRRSE